MVFTVCMSAYNMMLVRATKTEAKRLRHVQKEFEQMLALYSRKKKRGIR